MAEKYSTVWLFHILFNRLSVDEYLGSTYFLAIMNNAATNIRVQVFV